jgi:hypothetical protein
VNVLIDFISLYDEWMYIYRLTSGVLCNWDETY